MALRFRSQKTEKYYCPKCEIFKSFFEVNITWRCPDCNNNIQIKLKIDGFFHSCYRITPEQLKVGEIVTLENEFIHQVLAITRNGNQYRLALKEYTTINYNSDEIITRIDGGWYLD